MGERYSEQLRTGLNGDERLFTRHWLLDVLPRSEEFRGYRLPQAVLDFANGFAARAEALKTGKEAVTFKKIIAEILEGLGTATGKFQTHAYDTAMAASWLQHRHGVISDCVDCRTQTVGLVA